MVGRVLPFLLVLSVPAAAAPPPTLSFEEVRTGMRGTGRTTFEGTTVATFGVEILGKLPDIAPGQNLILARCSGGPLATTGILAGMSGSPVFVDDRLIGAVSYSWGFSKDAIAGITPIDEILAVGARDERGRPASRAGAGPLVRQSLDRLHAPDSWDAFLTRELPAALTRRAAFATSIPLAVSGIGAAGLARMAPGLVASGLLPVQAGSAGRSDDAPLLEPGSPIGVKLVRGDVDLTATGTVTWVDGARVFAFGHPLYGLGAIDLPLTAARVEALLPSLERSSRIAVALDELGAFRQDRATGIFGRLGQRPRMIPVRIQIGDGVGGTRRFAVDVADDPLLAPVLLYLSLNGVLESAERSFGPMTLRIRDGSVIRIDGSDDVELDNLFAGPTAPAYATGLSAYILYLLLNNEWTPPAVTGVNLILDYDPEPRTGTIRRVTLDRVRVHAGDSVGATIIVSPYRGPDAVFTREIRVPSETTPGRLLLQVGNAASVSRAESADDPVFPKDLSQLIRLINRLRRNDRIYVVASRADTGVFLGGARLPNLPPSAAGILTRPRSQGNLTALAQRGVLEEEIPTDFAVGGFARVQIEVEDR